jgi:hypothetical protein
VLATIQIPPHLCGVTASFTHRAVLALGLVIMPVYEIE